VTLPDPEVLDLLANDFVVGWSNIEREDHVGTSHGYSSNQTAVGTTNGAGARNVQLLVLSADGVVLHALPGFWHPADLADELRFARQIHRLWLDPERSRTQKEALFLCLHRFELARQSADTIARSDWQGFDRWSEIQRCQAGPRDTMLAAATGETATGAKNIELKPLNVVARERMMAQPFRKLTDFDVEAFVDYGRVLYDNNAGYDKGKIFAKAEKRAAEREKEAAKAAMEAQKAAEKAEKERKAAAAKTRKS
jgi:hypothetical protein